MTFLCSRIQGFERGLLQVVLNATTLGHILLDATDTGGSSSKIGRKITAAMKVFIHA